MKGIDVRYLEEKFNSIAKNNALTNVNISFSPPTVVNRVTNRNLSNMFEVSVIIEFDAVTDVNVYNFISLLENNKDYYILFREIEIKKTKDIDKIFINLLNSGTFVTAINGVIKLSIYGLK
jgi:hypothetical protein